MVNKKNATKGADNKNTSDVDAPKLSPTLKRQLHELFGNDIAWWFDDYNKHFNATNCEVIEKVKLRL